MIFLQPEMQNFRSRVFFEFEFLFNKTVDYTENCTFHIIPSFGIVSGLRICKSLNLSQILYIITREITYVKFRHIGYKSTTY